MRRDLDNHMATSDHQHLLLMMKAFNELKQETKKETEQLREEIKAQERRGPQYEGSQYGSDASYNNFFDSNDDLIPPIPNCCFNNNLTSTMMVL